VGLVGEGMVERTFIQASKEILSLCDQSNSGTLLAARPAERRIFEQNVKTKPDQERTIERLRLLLAQRRFCVRVPLLSLLATTSIEDVQTSEEYVTCKRDLSDDRLIRGMFEG
jgi:hypothetical protein